MGDGVYRWDVWWCGDIGGKMLECAGVHVNEPGILGWIPSRMGVGQVDIVMWEMGICGDTGVGCGM